MLMSSISAQDLQRLAGLQGYDLTLEIDALASMESVPKEIVALLRAANQPQQVSQQPFEPVASKEVPPIPNQPQQISMDGLRFQYDPTHEVNSVHQVDQAITCPGCGVALGIPSRRPIKIKCPQCMHVAAYN